MKNYKDKLSVFNSLTNEEKKWTAPNGYKNIDDNIILYSYIEYKDNTPVGFIDVYNLTGDPSIGEVVLAVNPKYRKQGIAKKLLNKALTAKYPNENTDLRYTVFNDNIKSKNLINNFYFSFHFYTKENGKNKHVYILNTIKE